MFSLVLGLEAAETSPTPALGHCPVLRGQSCAGGVGGRGVKGVMGRPLSEKIPPLPDPTAQVGSPPAGTPRPHPLGKLSLLWAGRLGLAAKGVGVGMRGPPPHTQRSQPTQSREGQHLSASTCCDGNKVPHLGVQPGRLPRGVRWERMRLTVAPQDQGLGVWQPESGPEPPLVTQGLQHGWGAVGQGLPVRSCDL